MGFKVDDHASLYVLFPASFSMYIYVYSFIELDFMEKDAVDEIFT